MDSFWLYFMVLFIFVTKLIEVKPKETSIILEMYYYCMTVTSHDSRVTSHDITTQLSQRSRVLSWSDSVQVVDASLLSLRQHTRKGSTVQVPSPQAPYFYQKESDVFYH
jgi:hypothetical protein